jgi:hypothetical protein
MKTLLTTGIFLLSSFTYALAQSSEKINVEAEEDISQAIDQVDQYRFKDFVKGKVYFKNGRSSTARLNYNLLYDAILFIDKKGDTLSLAEPEKVNYVAIQYTIFYYDKGYFEIIADYPSVKLAYKQVLKVSNREKIGGYGQQTNTSAIDNYSTVSNGNQTFNLKVNENVIFSKKAFYYLLDQNNRFSPANKRNIIKIFPKKHKKSIVQFIDDHETDFKNEQSIKSLLQFCGGLI